MPTWSLLPWTMVGITKNPEFTVHTTLILQVSMYGSPCSCPGISQWRREVEAERGQMAMFWGLYHHMLMGTQRSLKNPECKLGLPGHFTKEYFSRWEDKHLSKAWCISFKYLDICYGSFHLYFVLRFANIRTTWKFTRSQSYMFLKNPYIDRR